MEGIQVSVEKTGAQGDISVIRVGGYIDTTTSSELERALDSLLKTGVFRVIIDLGNVDYISSAGWGIFISEIKGIRERSGDLKLAKMIPDVYEVFELLEFHYILRAYDTIEDAINDFEKESGVVPFGDEGKGEKKRLKEMKKEKVEKAAEIVEMEDTSLEEKVKQIALDNPTWGAGKIAKELNTEKYGFVRLGSLSIWKMIRKLNLGGKKEERSQVEDDES